MGMRFDAVLLWRALLDKLRIRGASEEAMLESSIVPVVNIFPETEEFYGELDWDLTANASNETIIPARPGQQFYITRLTFYSAAALTAACLIEISRTAPNDAVAEPHFGFWAATGAVVSQNFTFPYAVRCKENTKVGLTTTGTSAGVSLHVAVGGFYA